MFLFSYIYHLLYIDEIITDPVVGKLFALISDEVWCRVRVVSVNGGKIQVFFVDHGDTTETTKAELRPLAPQFRQLPFQVRFKKKRGASNVYFSSLTLRTKLSYFWQLK